jgi:large subunit ribosomal protein L24
VLKLFPEKLKILVEGVNVRKRHTRPSQQNQKGGILSKEMPVDYSNVQIIDTDKNPTRIGIQFDDKGGKKEFVRIAKTNDKPIT